MKTYIPQRSGKKWEKIEKKKSFGFGKKQFRLQNRYRNWTSVLVPDTETEFWSHTKLVTKNQNSLFILFLESQLEKKSIQQVCLFCFQIETLNKEFAISHLVFGCRLMQWNKPLLAIPAWDNLASDLQTASKFVAPTSSTAENEKKKLIDAFKIQVQKSLFASA